MLLGPASDPALLRLFGGRLFGDFFNWFVSRGFLDHRLYGL